jgi:hypothetical protein
MARIYHNKGVVAQDPCQRCGLKCVENFGVEYSKIALLFLKVVPRTAWGQRGI